MAFNINQFKTNGLVFGGARPSLFQIQLTIPPAIPNIDPLAIPKLSFTARAAEIPASEIGQFEVPYFGRTIKLAGDRTFSNWAVTVMNDEDFMVRGMFEAWSNAINMLVANVRDPGAALEGYKAEMLVTQYAKDGAIIRAYSIVGAFPFSVGNIQLDWGQPNQIEEFAVTFAYDYWVPAAQVGTAYDPGLGIVVDQ